MRFRPSPPDPAVHDHSPVFQEKRNETNRFNRSGAGEVLRNCQMKRSENAHSVHNPFIVITSLNTGHTPLPTKDDDQRRLYGIYLVRFIAFRVPCRPKLVYFRA